MVGPSLPGTAGFPWRRVSSNIIEVLKLYKKEVPVDFVASVLGRSRQEIETELTGLEARGAVKREGDLVKLG